MFAISRIFYLFIFAAVLTMTIGMNSVQAVPSQSQPSQSEETSKILQFTSSGHVLGFQSSGMYIAAGSHMLRESFVGAREKIPYVDQPFVKDGQPQPLETVSYPNLWEAITLTYDRPSGSILRSTYQVKPWGNTDQIALRYNVPIQLDIAGNLVFEFDAGILTASAPVAWQEIDEKRVHVDVSFRLVSSQSTVQFSLGHYNPAFPLTIDPTMTWNTFMGSSEADKGHAIAIDGSGSVYIAGSSESGWGSPNNNHTGGFDAFAAKLNKSGALQWNTFMGSSETDYGYAIAVDGSGNVYVTGNSHATWGNPKNAHQGDDDAFAAKLNNSGDTVWTTFMGSPSNDSGKGIAVDGDENVYITGSGATSWGSPVVDHAGGISDDAFVAKLSNSGETVWNTFMGSSFYDCGNAIAVDESGNVYVAGNSSGTWGNPKNSYMDAEDAFVAKLSNSGATEWNTFMGSNSSDHGNAIAVDDSGNVYVAGSSLGYWGSPINTHSIGSNFDAFTAKLNSSDGARQWNTFMGSSADDEGYAIAVDRGRNVYVSGRSLATWGSPLNEHAGSNDAFAAKLIRNGVLQWHTFMGTFTPEESYSIDVDEYGNIYMTGYGESTWGNPVNDPAGSRDAFVAKILAGTLSPGIPLLLLNY